MKTIDKIVSYLIKASEIVMVLISVIMTIAMFLLVVNRYLFGTGITWTEELTRFINIWMILLGASVLARDNQHINVTILDGFLKGKAILALQIIRNLIYIVFSILLVYLGLQTLNVVAAQTSANMLIKMNYVYLAIPLGSLLTILYLALNSLKLIKKEQNNG